MSKINLRAEFMALFDGSRWMWALMGALTLALGWTWFSTPPPLSNANAPGDTVAHAWAAVLQRAATREQLVQVSAYLDGPQGDFEKRGHALLELTPSQQSVAVAALATDIRLLAEVASASEAERSALQQLDAALMGQTRDLGPQAEELRAATWPIVEHLKLYPPPLGLQTAWQPPDSTFFQTHAITLEQGTLEQQVAAATEVGRSTYALRQLRELDATYRSELETYSQRLQTIIDAGNSPQPLWRRLLAMGVTVVLGLIMVGALLARSPHTDWGLFAAIAVLGLWFVLPWPFAAPFAFVLIIIAALRPSKAILLPLLAIPLYYRPRTIAGLRFPLNETLFGLLGLGLVLHGIWRWRQGQLGAFLPLLKRYWPLFGLLSVLIIGGGLGLFAPDLIDSRVALREIRRTLIEPAIWAIGLLILLAARYLKPLDVVWAFCLMAAWIATDGLVRFALGEGIWATTGVPRLIGILPSSTALGAYLGAAAAGSLALGLTTSGRARLAAGLISLPLFMGLLLTFTRGAWIGVGLVLIGLLLLQRRWRLLIGLSSVIAFSFLSAAIVRPDALARVLRLSEGTGAARQEIWTAAARAVGDSPLLGLGMDQFAHIDPQRYGIPQIRFLTLSHPHNLVLDVWLQVGLVGLIAVSGLIGLGFWRGWQRRHTPMGIVALAIITELLVHGMLDQTMLGGDLIYLWWGLIVMIMPEPIDQEVVCQPQAMERNGRVVSVRQ